MYCIDKTVQNKLLGLIIPRIIIGSLFFPHGSFANIKMGEEILVSDIDLEDFLKFNSYYPSLEERNNIRRCIANHLMNLPVSIKFLNCIFGVDTRYLVNYELSEDGIIKFDKKEMSKRLKDNNHPELAIKCDNIKTTRDFFLFREYMEQYSQIKWTQKDIDNGFIFKNGSKFYFIDFIQKVSYSNPLILQYAYEYMPNRWIPIDNSILFYTCLKNINIKKMQITTEEYPRFRESIDLLNESRRITTDIWVYEGIFKNMSQDKYLKTIKRLRTLISMMLFYNFKDNLRKKYPDQVKNFFEIRKQIKQFTSQGEIASLNQIKNRIDLSLTMTKLGYNVAKFNNDIVEDLIKLGYKKVKINEQLLKSVKSVIETKTKPKYDEIVDKLNGYLLFDIKTVMDNLINDKMTK